MNMDDSSLTTWLAIVRAIHFASCLLIAGVWMFDRLIVRDHLPQWRRLAMAILLIATPLALLSGAAWFILVSANMNDVAITTVIRNAELLKLVWLQTQFGRAWQIHLAFWICGVLSAVIFTATPRGRWMGLLSAMGLVAGLAWAGHGSTGPAPVWHLAMDMTHLLAAAVWPAGLIPLALILPAMIRSDGQAKVLRIVRQFSLCSLIAVGLLTLTGLFNSWCLLGSFHALLTTPYGRMLLVKLIFFAAMIGLAAINLLILKPRLSESLASARQIWRNVLIEILLSTLVIVAVGLLGLIEPARTVEHTASVSSP